MSAIISIYIGVVDYSRRWVSILLRSITNDWRKFYREQSPRSKTFGKCKNLSDCSLYFRAKKKTRGPVKVLFGFIWGLQTSITARWASCPSWRQVLLTQRTAPSSVTPRDAHLWQTDRWNVQRPYRTLAINTLYRLCFGITNFAYRSMCQPPSPVLSLVNHEDCSLLRNSSGCSHLTYWQAECSNTLQHSSNKHSLQTSSRDHTLLIPLNMPAGLHGGRFDQPWGPSYLQNLSGCSPSLNW